jgi:multidrug efflux pump subunit AcrA (membrane-fusion protein)
MGQTARKYILWLLILVIAVIIILYMASPRPVEIKTAEVSEGTLELSLSSTGIVESQLIDISSRITAGITGLYLQEGEMVGAGQVLARLEDADLQAEVRRMQAAVQAAKDDEMALRESALAQNGQLRSARDRAKANLQASRDRLRDLELGSSREDIAVQRAALERARAGAEDARRRYVRAEQLLKAGAIPAQERDTAKANYDAARADVAAQEQLLQKLIIGPRTEVVQAAKADVKAAEAALKEAESALYLILSKKQEIASAGARVEEARAALRNAQAQLGYSLISSPVRGVAARKYKEIGELASPFDTIYTVANLDNIWVTAEVDEEDVAAVALGQAVQITLDAYPGQVIRGFVVKVSRIAEPKEVGRVRAKIVRAKIKLEKVDIPLRPGLEVNINGILPEKGRTLLIPNDAVVSVGNTDRVFLVQDGRVRSRKIVAGQSNFDFTQVLSGLHKGDLVAVTGLDNLRDGTRVRVNK